MCKNECESCEFAPMDTNNAEKPCMACKSPVAMPEIKERCAWEIREMIAQQEYDDEKKRTEKRKMTIAKKKIPYEELYALVGEVSRHTAEYCPVKEEYRECFFGWSDTAEKLDEMRERMLEITREAGNGFENRVNRRVAKKFRMIDEWEAKHNAQNSAERSEDGETN